MASRLCSLSVVCSCLVGLSCDSHAMAPSTCLEAYLGLRLLSTPFFIPTKIRVKVRIKEPVSKDWCLDGDADIAVNLLYIID